MIRNEDDKAYAMNKKIVADDFGDETVLINVERGLYFSMQGSAVDIWKAFDTPQLRSLAVATLARDLSGSERESIDLVIQSMIDHGLLIEADAKSGSEAKIYSFSATSYAAPVLGVFSDLAELIAIDPVHEVDQEAGWPVRPPSFPPIA